MANKTVKKTTKKATTKKTTAKKPIKKVTKKVVEPVVKEEVVKEDNSKKRNTIIGTLYIICSVLWIIGGLIKKNNGLDGFVLDFVAGFLLLLLGIVYFIKNNMEN